MPTTRLLLVTGDELEVDGSLDKVAKELENAARSGSGTLARITETATRQEMGVYPAQVVTVIPGKD